MAGMSAFADAGRGIDVGGGAAHDALENLEAHAACADPQLLADPAELCPRRQPPQMIMLGRKRIGLMGRCKTRSNSAHRREIDDVNALGGDVGEAVAGGADDTGRAAQAVLHVGRHELFDQRAAELGAQVAARHLFAAAADGERVSCVVEFGGERRQPLVAHQHQEGDLRQVLGRGGVEAARAILDGVGAVEREGLALAEVALPAAARATGL